MQFDAERLVAACADDSFESGITITTVLEPLAGPGAPVKPATYAGGVFQRDRRRRGVGADIAPVDAIVIDNVPSQANRVEAALCTLRLELGVVGRFYVLSTGGRLASS